MTVSDSQLVLSLLMEISTVELPRTLLLICECIGRFQALDSLMKVDDGKIGRIIATVIEKLGSCILKELKNIDGPIPDPTPIFVTVERFEAIANVFHDKAGDCRNLHLRMVEFLERVMRKAEK